MSKVVQCVSCGSSNQLPDGRTSMFCSFCGGAIENKIIQENQKNIIFPKIISKGKIELAFNDTEWYKDKIAMSKLITDSIIKDKVARDMYKMGVSPNIIKNIENYRTIDGYNTVINYAPKYGSFEGSKETEFVPFEYDYSQYESKLDLSSKEIESFEDILQHYDLEEIENITHLDLSNNNISNWDGFLNFKRLIKINLSNNKLNALPKDLLSFDKDLKYCPISPLLHLDVSNNLINLTQIEFANFESGLNVIDFESIVNIEDFPSTIFLETFLELTKDLKKRTVTTEYKLLKNEDEVNHNFFQITLSDETAIYYCQVSKIKEVVEEVNLDSSNEKGKCFVATATMGDYDHPEVMELRNFRDNWILRKSWGVTFVKYYYYYGEIIACKIEKNNFLKKISYLAIVKPLVFISRKIKH